MKKDEKLNWVDTYAFNITAIIICAIAAFFGMVLGFAGEKYGWLLLALGIAFAAFFILDLQRVSRIMAQREVANNQMNEIDAE